MSRIEEALRRATAFSNSGDVVADVSGAESTLALETNAAFTDVFRFETDVAPEPPEVDTSLSVERPAAADAPDVVVSGPGLWDHPVDDKLIISSEIKPIAVEQYRRTAAVLHHLQATSGTRVVMVASAIAGEGKTLTACNTALTLSESFHRRVLLIDADLRRPSVHHMFRLGNASGLNEALRAERDTKAPIVAVSPRLSVLPAGRPDPDPMGSLTSPRMRHIIEDASTAFDWVIIDTPPIGLLPDANLLAAMTDTVLLVIGAGSTPLHAIERAVKALDRSRIAGVVLNRVVNTGPEYGYYDYGSGKDRPRS